MFIKKMLLLVLASLLVAFLLMACKVPPEERTEADNLEIENIVNEVIEDLDQHNSEEEEPETRARTRERNGGYIRSAKGYVAV